MTCVSVCMYIYTHMNKYIYIFYNIKIPKCYLYFGAGYMYVHAESAESAYCQENINIYYC